MIGQRHLVFLPFDLNTTEQKLFCGSERVTLRAKNLRLLCYLAEHHHQSIGKQELLKGVWRGTRISEAVLKVGIGEIRKTLDDSAAMPRFIETVGRGGYRFIAPVTIELRESESIEVDGKPGVVPFVGRSAELERMRSLLARANRGDSQLLFISGEPGIGKTTLVEAFLRELPIGDGIVTARGQCIEQFGAGEAYLPVLDALEQICRSPQGDTALELLRRHAPSWLVNLTSLVSAEERAELVRHNLGSTPERRLREIGAFLAAMVQERSLVLVLEDLHWIDPSTLALISFLGRRRLAARLMLIATYREGEIERTHHPLKNLKMELQLHRQCTHLPLTLLGRPAVKEYLAARFKTPNVSSALLAAVFQRSEGNPLFMVNVTDELVSSNRIVRRADLMELQPAVDGLAVPTTIRQLIELQFQALDREDQELLQSASVAGMEFSTAITAPGLGKSPEQVERQCQLLAEREQFLRPSGCERLSDGTAMARFVFVHALYQNVIYERVTEAKRRRLHQAIGARLEEVFQGATEQVAAELALHFERAGDYQRAVRYLIQAAQKASQQSAYREAIDHATTALQLLKSLPDNRQRAEMELNLQIILGVSLASTLGYAAGEVSDAYNKANQLCHEVKDASLRMQALIGLFSFHCLRGEPRRALDFGKQMIRAAQSIKDAISRAAGHTYTGIALFYLGDFPSAREQFDRAVPASDLENRSALRMKRPDILAPLLTYHAVNLWLLGYPVRAATKRDQSLQLAKEYSHPLSLVLTQIMIAGYHQCQREVSETLKLADEGIRWSREYGFAHWLAAGNMCKGWALANLGQRETGVTLLREGLKDWRAIGSKTETARFMSLLVEIYLLTDRVKEGLSLVDEALSLIEETEDRFYQSELTRLRGELLIKSKPRAGKRAVLDEAESHFLKSIEISRNQQAKSFELRATISLARLWQKTGKTKEAKAMLARIYSWFTEGFDTPDLIDAKELLDRLP